MPVARTAAKLAFAAALLISKGVEAEEAPADAKPLTNPLDDSATPGWIKTFLERSEAQRPQWIAHHDTNVRQFTPLLKMAKRARVIAGAAELRAADGLRMPLIENGRIIVPTKEAKAEWIEKFAKAVTHAKEESKLLKSGERWMTPLIKLSEFEVGDVGMAGGFDDEGDDYVASVRVSQVVNETEMLVEQGDRSYWLRGFGTANLADDDSFSLNKCIRVPGNTTYTTVLGGTKTILVLELFDPVEVKPYREALIAFRAAEKASKGKSKKPPAPRAKAAEKKNAP